MDDLRRRLRRMGVTTGRDFQAKPRISAGPDIDGLTDGAVVQTDAGDCFVIERVYTLDTFHGPHQLSEWHSLNPSSLAHISSKTGARVTAALK